MINFTKLKEVCMRGSLINVAVILTVVFAANTASFSQQPNVVPAVEKQPAINDMLWVWGEVVSVNGQEKAIVVKYLDYDTDVEKEMTIAVDDKTKFENVSTITDIKMQDTVSVDYTVSQDKNLAQVISVEKLDEVPDEPVETPGLLPNPETTTTIDTAPAK
jgi:hypothetical protein